MLKMSFWRLDVLTLKCHHVLMGTQKRATVYFEADVHRALRLKAAASDRSISDMVNDAVKVALAEDVDDSMAFSERNDEKSLSFDTFVQRLRQRGRI